MKQTIIDETQVGLLLKKGRIMNTLEAGAYRTWRSTDVIHVFSRKLDWLTTGAVEYTTKDNGCIKMNVAYRLTVSDVKKYFLAGGESDDSWQQYTMKGANSGSSISMEVKALLREQVNKVTLEEILADAAIVLVGLEEAIQPICDEIGVKAERFIVFDWTPAGNLRQAANDVLKAELEGKAALVRARNEAATMRSLANTARMVREQPGLLELRTLALMQGQRARFNVNVGSSASTEEA